MKMPQIKKAVEAVVGNNEFNQLVKNSLITALPSPTLVSNESQSNIEGSDIYGSNRFLSPQSSTAINFMTSPRDSMFNLN
jgi:hypothetical protein